MPKASHIVGLKLFIGYTLYCTALYINFKKFPYKTSIFNCGRPISFLPCAPEETVVDVDADDYDAILYSVSQPLCGSDIFFLNVWEFLVQISHAYYGFLSTLDYKLSFNYLQL